MSTQTQHKEVSRAKAPSLALQAAALKERANRDARGQFLLEGARMIELALHHNALQSLLYAPPLSALGRHLVEVARAQNVARAPISRAQLNALAQGQEPQGLVGIAARATLTLDEANAHEGVWLALESVRKPGNLGSLLRTAQAAGARGILAAGNAVDFFDPAAVRASMGAFWSQTLVRASWDELFRFRARHHQVWLGTALHNARPYTAIAYPRDLWLWLGDERRGLSPRALKACRTLAHIPICEGVDSLNVGVAAGVMLFEMRRRREEKHGPQN